MRLPGVLVSGLFAASVACGNRVVYVNNIMLANGSYAYTARDSLGSDLVVGTLTLNLKPDGTITGTWTTHLAPGVPATTQVGPQVGSGKLEGSVTPTGISINLNPEMADNNVFLNGSPSAESVTGTWTYSTIAGPRVGGRFSATPFP